MTTTTEMREALVAISTQLGNAITGSQASEQPHATLVASLDQIRGFVGAMAEAITDEPPTMFGEAKQVDSVLWCALCIQDARNREAVGEIPLPIHPAATLINGNALCDVEGRHRIITPTQFAAQQASGLLLPGQMPPGALGPLNGQG